MARVLIAYNPTRIGRDHTGKLLLAEHILSTVADVTQALKLRDHKVEGAALRRDPRWFLSFAQRFRPHVVFNLCEGVGGEATLEKNAAALFEMRRLRYTGNDCLALGICLEKALTKQILRSARIDTPDFTTVPLGHELEEHIELPVIVKPAMSDGSAGITVRSVCKTMEAVRSRIGYVHRVFRQTALVEKYIAGREFQVGLLGNDEPRVLAVAELSYAGLPKGMPRICSWAAKWQPGSSYYRHTNPLLPAPVPYAMRRKLESIALRVFRLLRMRGYARVDFRMRRNRPQVIDVNPNPDISRDAGLARAARHARISYAELCHRIVQLALE
jgi:D-alanine-D-alanine ligase